MERDATAFASLAEDAVPGRHPSLRAAFAGAARRYRRAEGGRVLLVDLAAAPSSTPVRRTALPGVPGGAPRSSAPSTARSPWHALVAHAGARPAVRRRARGLRRAGQRRGAGDLPDLGGGARVRRDWLLLAAVGVVVLALAALVSGASPRP